MFKKSFKITWALALIALCLGLSGTANAAAFSPSSGMSDYANIVELNCNYQYRPGREFQFPSADKVLQPYGFILWKSKPSLVSPPLDYSLNLGRRGKLSGEFVYNDGIRWFTGVMDDCSRVYAEDASAHAERSSLEHLMFHGKVFFADTYAAAKTLIGHDVIVRGKGLEPRQRLYTQQRKQYYSLSDGQVLKVVGIDTHRYAHAKGVGPFFLRVENAQKQQGLIKFNPDYLEVPYGVLPVYQRTPARVFVDDPLPARASTGGSRPSGNQPMLGENAFALTVKHFNSEAEGLAAELELKQAGFSARLMPTTTAQGLSYELQVEGFASERLATSMARILANRFGWIAPTGVNNRPTMQAVDTSGAGRKR